MILFIGCIFIGLMIYMFCRGVLFSFGLLLFGAKIFGLFCLGYAAYLLIKKYL